MSDLKARLGRIPEFDSRSRRYPVTAHPRFQAVTRGRSWWLPRPFLNQGPYPHCVGFAGAHRLLSTPVMRHGVNEGTARVLYTEAQEHDQWPGTDYAGTSGLGLAKTLLERGWIDSYYWCFTVDQLLQAVATAGPVLVGSVWYWSMEEPSENGLLEIDPGSGEAGGHETLWRGIILKPRFCDEPVFRVANSWGETWGERGECFIRYSDARDKLLPVEADALVVHEVR